MPSTVSVTIGSKGILHDAMRVVRRQFPGASVNEILRYCGLAVARGTREAERIVFGSVNDSEPTGHRIYGKIPSDEHAIIEEYLRSDHGITSISELYRAGMHLMAGDAPADALKQAHMKMGNPHHKGQELTGQ